jgi:hypothetical protein
VHLPKRRRQGEEDIIYSLMLTCRACGVEPLAWLRHVLTELPQRSHDADIDDLLPFNFERHA